MNNWILGIVVVLIILMVVLIMLILTNVIAIKNSGMRIFVLVLLSILTMSGFVFEIVYFPKRQKYTLLT